MGATPRQHRYLDLPFILEAQGIFDKAEQVVAGNDTLMRRVRHARLPLDRACLVLFPDLLSQWIKGEHAPETIPLDRDAIAARCKDTWNAQIDFRIPQPERDGARTEIDAELGTAAEPSRLRAAAGEIPRAAAQPGF